MTTPLPKGWTRHYTERVEGSDRDAASDINAVAKLEAADGGHWWTTDTGLQVARRDGRYPTCGSPRCINPEHLEKRS
jgi:hypothetical protein